jgi:hypothetical protein
MFREIRDDVIVRESGRKGPVIPGRPAGPAPADKGMFRPCFSSALSLAP